MNLLQKMTVEESYSHIVTTMFGTVAKLVLVADIVLMFSYGANILENNFQQTNSRTETT